MLEQHPIHNISYKEKKISAMANSTSIFADVPQAASSAGAPTQRKKRNQPGTPSPHAEVIALSPQTLMATNRFVCEVCKKGFQREQNLQLHRRGHNLPWKLKAKSSTQVLRKKVYVCPEPGCVHHDPVRALGDLTGIKKHYFRKHGEKTFRCEKCNKSYAVKSDWKVHFKTCGTKEYMFECGTNFSRRDSYHTHRGYCDALTQETARHPMIPTSIAATIYANASSGSAMTIATVGPTISVDELGLGLGGLACGSRTSFTSLLSRQLSVGSALRPIQPVTIPNPTEDKLMFHKVSNFSGYSSPYNLNNFNFSVGPGSLQNVADSTNCNMFYGTMNDADQAPVYTLPTPQLSATTFLHKASLMGSNSHGLPFVNNPGSSSTCGLRMNNYNTSAEYGNGIVSGGFQELLFNSMVVDGGSSSVHENGRFSGEVDNDDGLYNVKSAMDLEKNQVERQVSVQSGYCSKLTRDFLGMGNMRKSTSGGEVEEEIEANSPNIEATTSAGVVPFVRQRMDLESLRKQREFKLVTHMRLNLIK